MITKNAIRLINVISAEHMTHVRRAEAGFIPAIRVHACTIGGLMAKSRRDVDLKTFLETEAFIPEEEDTGDNYPWAEDRREAGDHTVRTRLSDRQQDSEAPFPSPGERVC